jgi:hypothetical protein
VTGPGVGANYGGGSGGGYGGTYTGGDGIIVVTYTPSAGGAVEDTQQVIMMQ